MRKVNDVRNPEFQDIYKATNDRRMLTRNNSEDYQAHWDELNAIVSNHPEMLPQLRDTHCREAIMWWTHHISESQRSKFRQVNTTVPLMPVAEKPGTAARPCGGNTSASDVNHLCVHLEQPNSCDWCHSTQAKHDSGGAAYTVPNALKFFNGPDDGNPHNWDRQRRCDQDQMPRCQICEGIGGHCYGDKNEDCDIVQCQKVATPMEVGCKGCDNSSVPCTQEMCNGTDVHWPLYPKQFSIHEVNGRPGYSDTLIGWKTDPFCFSFFPQNDSHGPLCYRSQDSVAKYYDIEQEATRSDYNVKLTGPFSIFPNITAQIMQVGWEMWINNHLWVVDQCVCANPSGEHCTAHLHGGECYSYVWHWDTFATAQYLGRENIGVEWIQNAGVGKSAKMWELDHFIMWSHHAWTDPKSGKIVRMWKSFNGLQNYDPEAWTIGPVPDGTFPARPPPDGGHAPQGGPAKCKKGGAKVRIHCDDNGNFHGNMTEGLEHLDALYEVARNAEKLLTHEEIKIRYEEVMARRR
jgi:hypothetical protein